MSTSASTLTCPQCSYVNEPERVYCHNCGAKLDRSLLPKEDDKKTRETIERTRRRVKRMTNPGRGLQDVKTAISTLIWAAIVAALILIARRPDDVPARADGLADRLVGVDLLDAVESPQPRVIRFTERDVNQHLSNAHSKTQSIFGIKFQRAFAKLDPGVIRIGMQQSLWGYPVYSGVAYKLQIKDNKLVATPIAGNFGRLKIHPEAMVYGSKAFKQLWNAMSREKQQLDKMQAVRVDKGVITFVSRGVTR